MSLNGPALQAFQWAESQYKQAVSDRLKHTLESGRCTPAEADAISRQMSAVKLSLDTSGTPAKGDVEKWLDSRAAVPQGTFWTSQQRTEAAAQKLSVVEPRTEWTSKAGPTAADLAEAKKILMS
jgi:hypothetical protein